MRVAAPRPRHTSHGEDKNTADNAEGGEESSGDAATASGTKEGATKEKTGEGADDEEATA
jgi:hypothetical protein